MVKTRRVMEQGREREELDRLIVSGIRRIRKSWAKLGSRKLGAGAYGKQKLLQEIYTVYCDWRDSGWTKAIWKRLANGLRFKSENPTAQILTRLIMIAIPDVKPDVVGMWVDAIRYGEAHHVRPYKLHGFLYVKEGLVRCAKLFRQEERARQEEEDNRRLDEEERQARMKQAGQQARRRRNAPKRPAGRFELFER